MQEAASQTADDDRSNRSAGTLTSPSVVLVPNAGADFEGHGAGLVPNHFLGLRTVSGRPIDPDGVKEVIGLLERAGIPACVVGVCALRYLSAGRIPSEWDICIPDEKLDTAQAIFDNDIRFEQAVPPPLLSKSLRHIRTTFILKNVEFVFILVPASDHFVNLICYE